MRYIYTGGPDGDQWFAGLPAQDLDTETLTEAQQVILAVAITKGLYVPASPEGPIEINESQLQTRSTKLNGSKKPPSAEEHGERPSGTDHK